MACDRCGAPVARDGVIVKAAFTTVNGRRLHLEVSMKASADAAGLRAQMFCEPCFLLLLQLFSQIGEAHRVTLD
jgi:hypothetical protein